MEQMIIYPPLPKINALQNLKEKSKTGMNLKSIKSKKCIIPIQVKKIYSGRRSNAEKNFETLIESKNFQMNKKNP